MTFSRVFFHVEDFGRPNILLYKPPSSLQGAFLRQETDQWVNPGGLSSNYIIFDDSSIMRFFTTSKWAFLDRSIGIKVTNLYSKSV